MDDITRFDDPDVPWEAEDAVITAAAVTFADQPVAVDVRYTASLAASCVLVSVSRWNIAASFGLDPRRGSHLVARPVEGPCSPGARPRP